MNERTESREMNIRISTLIMRGLSATEAKRQAVAEESAELTRKVAADNAVEPLWVRTCNRPGCVLTSQHRHGIPA
jgi:hypothetical protein